MLPCLLRHRKVRSPAPLVFASALAVAGAGCGSDAGARSQQDCGVVEPVYPTVDDSYDDANAADQRKACKFGKDALVTSTVGPDVAIGPDKQIPLKHLVVLMMENRSFDHYLGGLETAEGALDRTNPDPSAPAGPDQTVPQWHETHFCTGSPDHEWGASHLQFDLGRLDGFVMASNPGGRRAMSYYTADEIPFFYWLARNFAISDHHFSSLLGPTWPNRLFFMAGNSCGFAEGTDTNYLVTLSCGIHVRTVFDQLDEANASYLVFSDAAVPLAGSFYVDVGAFAPNPSDPLNVKRTLRATKITDIDDFESRAMANTLPDLSIVEPHYQSEVEKEKFLLGQSNDDHPPGNIQLGEQFIYRIVKAVMSSPDTWASTALIISYDENGGYYDHMMPPRACEPDPTQPPSDYRFDRLGFRVPLLVISPFVRPGYVSKRVTDHTSILRFIQAWKGLGALTGRDANAWPLLDIFDFSRTPSPPPDISALAPQVTAAAQADCQGAGAATEAP